MGKGKEKEQVNDGNLTLTVPESILERLMNLAEGNEERTAKKEAKYQVEVDFIREQIKRVQKKIEKTDILSDEYQELVRIYDQLMDVIRYI